MNQIVVATTAMLTGGVVCGQDSQSLESVVVTADGEVIDVAGGAEAFLGFGDPKNDLQSTIVSLTLQHTVSDALSFRATAQARVIALLVFSPMMRGQR